MRTRRLLALLLCFPFTAHAAGVTLNTALPSAPIGPQVAGLGASSLGLAPLGLPTALPVALPLTSSLLLPSVLAPQPLTPAARMAPAQGLVSVGPALGTQSQGRSPAAASPEEAAGTFRGQPNQLGQRFKELKASFGDKSASALVPSAEGLGELAPARAAFDRQIDAMSSELGERTDTLQTVSHLGGLLLTRVAEHMRKGRIDPAHAAIRTSADEPAPPVAGKTLRIGVYPVAADPFQWAHILIALKAMAEFQLDKVVFVLAGDDPRKPTMTKSDFRHPMGRAVLDAFAPLFAYSSIAVGTTYDGETNIMRMLQLNPEQGIHAFYIVGGDHYQLKDKKGNDDTLLKIQKKLEAPGSVDPSRHKVSLAFIERDEPLARVPTPLDVHFLTGVGFDASSTLVRSGRYDLMPWAAYDYVRSHRPGLYGISGNAPAPAGVSSLAP